MFEVDAEYAKLRDLLEAGNIAIEKLIEDYDIEEVITGLANYCQTKAITTTGKTKEFRHDVAETLQKVTDGWVDE